MNPLWRHLPARAVLLLVVLLADANPSAAQLANSAWPKHQHDLQNTGRSSTLSGPIGPSPRILWRYRSRGGERRAAVTVAPDGTLIVPNGRHPISGHDPATGAMLWNAKQHGEIWTTIDRSQPAISSNGTIYFGERGNNLWSFTPPGTINWRYKVRADGDVETPPTVGPDGTIYMASDALSSGWFFAMNPDGSVKWKCITGGATHNVSPALSPDGETVYVTTGARILVAVDTATGVEIWRTILSPGGTGNRHSNFSPVIAPDGTIYVANLHGVSAMEPVNGTRLWEARFGSTQFSSPPALGADGTLYVGGTGAPSRFYALDPSDGSVLWSHRMTDEGRFKNTPAIIDANGNIFVGYATKYYAFDGDGDGAGNSRVLWTLDIGLVIESGLTLAADGLLIGGAGRDLVAIGD